MVELGEDGVPWATFDEHRERLVARPFGDGVLVESGWATPFVAKLGEGRVAVVRSEEALGAAHGWWLDAPRAPHAPPLWLTAGASRFVLPGASVPDMRWAVFSADSPTRAALLELREQPHRLARHLLGEPVPTTVLVEPTDGMEPEAVAFTACRRAVMVVRPDARHVTTARREALALLLHELAHTRLPIFAESLTPLDEGLATFFELAAAARSGDLARAAERLDGALALTSHALDPEGRFVGLARVTRWALVSSVVVPARSFDCLVQELRARPESVVDVSALREALRRSLGIELPAADLHEPRPRVAESVTRALGDAAPERQRRLGQLLLRSGWAQR